MSDNPRNEVKINLAGSERVMRATFSSMSAIERELGKPWAALGQMVVDGSYGLRDVAVIVHHGLKGYGDTRLNLDEVGDAVAEHGLNAMMKPVVEFISVGFNGVKGVGKSDTPVPAAAQ